MSASPICVDASFFARLFMGPEEARAWELLDSWWEQKVALYSATLLHYELADVFYRHRRDGCRLGRLRRRRLSRG